jgi:molybdate transport system substrate-binding protein
MRIKTIVFFVMVSISLQSQTVKIAAAGNLQFILADIKTRYSTLHPKTTLIINIGSSGALSQQITDGADFDLFMAADRIYPDKLKARGLVAGKVIVYAYGKLVLWSNSLDVSKGLQILTDKSVSRIAVANPEVAPYGDRAVQCLRYYQLYDKVKDKIVYADNIAQTAQYVQTGNAETGFLALALLMAPGMKGSFFTIDPISYKPIEQALVLVKSNQTNPEAAEFVKFLLSPQCKPDFEKYGYIVP